MLSNVPVLADVIHIKDIIRDRKPCTSVASVRAANLSMRMPSAMRRCCVRKLVWLLEELQWLRSRLEHDRKQHQLQITYLCRQNRNLGLVTKQHLHL